MDQEGEAVGLSPDLPAPVLWPRAVPFTSGPPLPHVEIILTLVDCVSLTGQSLG